MQRLLVVLNLFAIVLLPGCDQQKTDKAKALVGTWYGEQERKGLIVRWLNKRKADGKFEIVSLVCEGAEPRGTIKQYGDWELRDGTYRTTTTLMESKKGKRAPDNPEKVQIEAYRVVNVGDNVFTYTHTETNVEYSVEKVDASYDLTCS